ncbi:MAG: cyclic nucleotide-binding domain-containing protein [candidate division Zixibacteria bacterium]|nr:cyclic nucleotide-binding domain-containing protein [candidate division Zixibacteria bacterium]
MDLPLGYLFRDLDDDQLKRIAAVAREIPMEKGQQICREGEEAKELYILKTGAVELMTKVEHDVELPISILRKPGDIFGAGVLVAPYQYALTARCAGKGVLFSIKRSAIQKLMMEDRDLGCIIMTNLAAHFLGRLKESRREIKVHFSTLLRSYS